MKHKQPYLRFELSESSLLSMTLSCPTQTLYDVMVIEVNLGLVWFDFFV